MQNWFDLIQAQAAAAPNAAAILALDGKTLTYSDLVEQAKTKMSHLSGMGVQRNDRVAIVLPNGPEAAVSFLAVSSIATSAPLNPAYSVDEFSFYFSDLEAKALVTTTDATPAAIKAAGALNIPVAYFDQGHSDTAANVMANPAQIDDVALVLHTSGTTARPKIVPLTQRNLLCSAQNIARFLSLRATDRCLNVMPLFHVHGLVAAVLASLTSGSSVVCTPGFYLAEFFEWMEKFEPTWFTAVPTIHQSIVSRASGVSKFSRLRFVRSSSSALAPKLMAEIERVFGVPAIEAYGMTEASHQMASNPLPPRERKPGSVGVAAGPEVAVMDNAGQVLPNGTMGEVVIRGENVTRGYARNPEANEKAFTNSWFRTGDEGYIDNEGYLFLTGRIKEIINRGGEKISPREIDEVLLDHPAIGQAAAFAIPDLKLGEDLAAAVVLRNGKMVSEKDIRNFVATRLAYFKVPARVFILTEIPKGPTGKIQRIGLARKLGLTGEEPVAAARPGYVRPKSETETTLARIWEEVLGVERVGLNDNFFHLGGDSLAATRVAARIRKNLGIDLRVTDLYSAPTLAEQALLLGEFEATEP